MSVFDLNADTSGSLDWAILRDGGVSLYRDREYLAEDVAALKSAGYRSVSFNCSTWWTQAKMHEELEEALGFPTYYGRNLNALWDCLQDVDVPEVGGLLIVFNGYSQFVASKDREVARKLVDIFASSSRYHLLMGRRLILLVQSDDPGLRLDSLAAVDAAWNRREWLNKDRGL